MSIGIKRGLISLVLLLLALSIGSGVLAAEKITLVMWGKYDEVMAKIVPLFEQKFPHVDLKMEYVSSEVSKFLTAYTAGLAPDLVFIATRDAAQYIEAGMVVPVDFAALSAGNKRAFFDRYLPGLEGAISYKGQLYNLPAEITSGGMLYNQDILNQAGIRQIPTTWQELTTIGAKISNYDASGKPTRVGIAINTPAQWVVRYWITMIRQAGSDWITPDGKANFSSPGSRAAITAYREMFASGAAYRGQNQGAFLQHRAAFLPTGTYRVFGIPEDLMLGATSYPQFQGGVPYNFCYGWGIYVTSQCKYPELAWQVAEFFTSLQVAPFYMAQGLVIPFKGSWILEEMRKQPALTPFLYGLEHASLDISHPKNLEIENAVKKAETDILTNVKPVATALLELDETLNAVLNDKRPPAGLPVPGRTN